MIPSDRFLEIRPVPQTPPKAVYVLSRSSSQAVEPRELLLQTSGGRECDWFFYIAGNDVNKTEKVNHVKAPQRR